MNRPACPGQVPKACRPPRRGCRRAASRSCGPGTPPPAPSAETGQAGRRAARGDRRGLCWLTVWFCRVRLHADRPALQTTPGPRVVGTDRGLASPVPAWGFPHPGWGQGLEACPRPRLGISPTQVGDKGWRRAAVGGRALGAAGPHPKRCAGRTSNQQDKTLGKASRNAGAGSRRDGHPATGRMRGPRTAYLNLAEKR
jgi:hypothetical protein